MFDDELFDEFQFVNDNLFSLNQEFEPDAFLESYLKFIEITLNKLFEADSTHGEIEVITVAEADFMVSQMLLEETDNIQIMTFFSGEFEILKEMNKEYVGHIAQKYNISPTEVTQENTIDLCMEILNNVNGNCTIKLDLDFDLEVPQHFEKVTLETSSLYRVKFEIRGYEMYFYVVFGRDYTFVTD